MAAGRVSMPMSVGRGPPPNAAGRTNDIATVLGVIGGVAGLGLAAYGGYHAYNAYKKYDYARQEDLYTNGKRENPFVAAADARHEAARPEIQMEDVRFGSAEDYPISPVKKARYDQEYAAFKAQVDPHLNFHITRQNYRDKIGMR